MQTDTATYATTLEDGSVFFTLEGAREFALKAYEAGVADASISISIDPFSMEDAITLSLRYREYTTGTRTRASSTNIQNPDAYQTWADNTKVQSYR